MFNALPSPLPNDSPTRNFYYIIVVMRLRMKFQYQYNGVRDANTLQKGRNEGILSLFF